MTDKKMYKLLTEFANQHSLAVANDVKVEIIAGHKSFTPRDEHATAYYDDINMLADLIKGAECFLLWARRNKVKI